MQCQALRVLLGNFWVYGLIGKNYPNKNLHRKYGSFRSIASFAIQIKNCYESSLISFLSIPETLIRISLRSVLHRDWITINFGSPASRNYTVHSVFISFRNFDDNSLSPDCYIVKYRLKHAFLDFNSCQPDHRFSTRSGFAIEERKIANWKAKIDVGKKNVRKGHALRVVVNSEPWQPLAAILKSA